MGKRYGQLGIEERCEIARLRKEGRSIRQIAATLDRSPPTIARELKRNGTRDGGYRATYAHEQARARRWCGARLEREDELRAYVLERLKRGWPPETVAGRLKRERGKSVISHESIYRFLYAQIARTKDCGWRHYLRRGKWKRGDAPTWGEQPSLIHSQATPALRASGIGSGPSGVRALGGGRDAVRQEWTDGADAARAPFTAAARGSAAIDGSRTGRHSDGRHPGAAAPGVPPDGHVRQRHRVRPPLRTPRMGHRDVLLRYLLSVAEGRCGERYRTDAPVLTAQDGRGLAVEEGFTAPFSVYNNTPRKCLDYQTPAEVLRDQVLHFECEFTFPPAPE